MLSILLTAALATAQTIPQQAQVVDQKSFNVLETVQPPSEVNLTTVRTYFNTCSSYND